MCMLSPVYSLFLLLFFRKIVKFAIVLIPLFGVIYLVFAPFPTGINENADIIVLYCEMFYNSLQVSYGACLTDKVPYSEI